MPSKIRAILIGKSFKNTLIRILLSALITWLCFSRIIKVCHLDGSSMEPTYRNRSLHVVNLIKYHFTDVARGDVVIIRASGNRTFYLKRIIGLPEETIQFLDGELRINGAPYKESYISSRGSWDMEDVKLGPDEYFVSGDNRSVPIEQHLMGTVKLKKIAGGLLW